MALHGPCSPSARALHKSTRLWVFEIQLGVYPAVPGFGGAARQQELIHNKTECASAKTNKSPIDVDAQEPGVSANSNVCEDLHLILRTPEGESGADGS